MPNPARTINYEENIGRWAWATKRAYSGCSGVGEGIEPGAGGVMHGWHGKDWNYTHAFVDGHAGSRQIYVDGSEDAGGYGYHFVGEILNESPASNCCQPGTQCAPTAGNFNSVCYTVRGDGWQKDTLPATPVCTGYFSASGNRANNEGCVTNP
ncbi:MAG: hypothetical protein HY287_14460 [Planctomycetes bacterium]|nr:hypothetical protein [Planctomycetota bacterium]MBI3835525.1 hypothetical protein [Planctomycetota bacterium]